MAQWHVWLGRIARRIWFRAAIISVLSVVLALASAVLAPLIPYEFSLKIGSDAVDNILTILASSMLAVTTFSLAAMVTAFSRASQQVTPRAAQLLIEDKTAQNALSTFLGAFLFGIVGIIALSTDMYGSQGRVILYVGTILLVAWIAIVLLRWIHTLTEFGRVEDAIRRVEHAAIAAVCGHKGPIRMTGPSDLPMPATAAIVPSPATGYVTLIDREALSCCARETNSPVTVRAEVGQWISRGQPLAWTTGLFEPDWGKAIAEAFVIEGQRSFDEDPRFAMVVLAEIGSRALSAAVNDPGTAIAALNAGQRVMEAFRDAPAPADSFPGVTEPDLVLESMVEDLIRPIARDGAPIAEVGIRIQHWLGAVAAEFPPATDAMRRLADDAFARLADTDISPVDESRIDQARRRAFGSFRSE